MAEIRYVIKGDPRTKKNHMMIAAAGPKCPRCGKHEKQWVRQAVSHDNYAELAGWQLRPIPPRPIECPVNVKWIAYMGTQRKIDKSNLENTVLDLLVSAGILADDNRDIVAGTDGSRVYYDPDNPRMEITITKMEGYEQWKKKPKAAKITPGQISLF